MIKEAMKLALEALEYIDFTDNDRDFLHPHECYMIDKAITALREALAEQPAQQQEPVAWMIWTHGPVLVFMNKDEANLEFDRLNHTYPAPTRMLVPLYTSTPAQRKPLTDKEIEQCMKQAYATVQGRNLEHAFARAIEAAHGIRENT